MDLSPDLLRTLVAFAETGSLARAAHVVNRTPSAITAQMQKLELTVGRQLFLPVGRGRVLTDAGAELVSHARRVLAAHRDLRLAMEGARSEGRVSLGLTQDFAGRDLEELLGAFSRSHARLRFELRIGRSAALLRDLTEGTLDVALTMRLPCDVPELAVLHEPMQWLSASTLAVAPDGDLPLALLDPPCGFREAALRTLDAAGRSYVLTATSPSLSGLRTAVAAGLAMTVRTRRFMDARIGACPEALRLPVLPEAEFSLRCRADAAPAARTLADLIAEDLRIAPKVGR